ncbi:TPA: hypothetical protein ACT9LS_002112 [Legionella pneumophila]|nr:hypothetical protein [Legionella pneumophila]HAU0773265.1 hypothetical protein [Legionella pneumophila]HAU0871349.1 hypothetical protein [Legionella pneumophila]HAU0889661.1 hypothetical protein [Legionella pneumophila]HCD9489904.1 hypothetical protein [Legionella pneumophila]
MNTATMPIERLMSECDNIQYASKTCCYTGCSNSPITSHTISENYLYKLNKDLTKVLTFQPKIGQVAKKYNPQHVTKVDKKKFSTFVGFCEAHDNDLFSLLDNFNGKMNKEKAALVHYRNICYGISHIKTQKYRERHVAQQNYMQQNGEIDSESILPLLKNGALQVRLSYCLQEHLQRKRILEKAIKSKDFESIDFIEIEGGGNNPIFSGRSSYLMHPRNKLFDFPGYAFMPWVSYMTLLTHTSNHLVFCWLKSDKKHSRALGNIIKNKEFKNTLAILAYGSSDSFAIEESVLASHAATIEKVIESFRVY